VVAASPLQGLVAIYFFVAVMGCLLGMQYRAHALFEPLHLWMLL
jgi:hypothetical protein